MSSAKWINKIPEEYRKFARQAIVEKLYEIGTELNKKQCEMYDGVYRRIVVPLPEIQALFDMNGVDIVELDEF